MTTYTDAEKFLQAVFGNDYGTAAILANLNPAVHVRSVDQLDAERDCYWSIAAYPPGYTGTNTEAAALEVRALVIDDVGTKVSEGAVLLALGKPTRVTLTSAGNYQWAYRLAKPVAVDDWAGFFGGVEALIAKPLEARAAQTLMRLPMGKNTKPQNKSKASPSGFQVQAVEIEPGPPLDPDTIPQVKVSRPGPPAGASKPWVHHIKEMVAILPNDVEWDGWVDVGQRILAIAVDKEDGREAFHEFSSRTTLKVYDEAVTERRWQSFTADRTRGGLLVDAVQKIGSAAVDAWWQMEAPYVFDDGAVPPPVPPKGDVKFILGKKDTILSMMENAKRAVVGLGLVCRYDEFHHRAFIERPDGTSARVDDKIVLMLRDEITAAYGKEFGLLHVGEAIMTLAYLNGFNPVVEMLAEAEAGWDGVKRLDRLGPDYFHTEKSRLAEACFRKVMIAAVRRARSPGCKFDQILVLESPEGWDKSTAWRMLAGDENFSDADILAKGAKEVQEELADIWIHEIADLAGLSRADVDHVKSFASRQNDRARPAYGRFLLDQPRQSIEVGTTNAETYLASPTGNRRFWTFKLSARVEIAKLKVDRLQLWGEAAAAESLGETLVLDSKLWDAAAAAQEDRRVVDPWEDELMNLPDMAIKDVGGGEEGITNVAIHSHLGGGHRGGQLTGSSGRKISEIMKRLGWERTYIMDAEGKKVRGYKRRTDRTVGPEVDVSSVLKNPF